MNRRSLVVLAGALGVSACGPPEAATVDAPPDSQASVTAEAPPHYQESEATGLRPAELEWTELGLVPEVDVALLSGNPAGAGHYVLRLRFPPDTRMPAHWHPRVEYATILSGTLMLAMGEEEDPDRLEAYPAGTFMVLPAEMAHYGRSLDEVVIELSGPGPYEVVFVDEADDPRIP